MVILENLIVAIQSLIANKLRSVLTLVGIAIGIGAVLYVVVLGELTQKRIKQRLESLGSNVLLIRPGYSRMRGVRTSADVVNLKWTDAREIVQNSEVITRAVPIYSGAGNMEFLDKNWNTRVTGTLPEFVYINNEKVVEGRFFNEDELKYRSRVCVLGATVYENLFDNKDPIGESVYINSKNFLDISF